MKPREIKDLTGLKFGRLKVVKLVGKNDKSGYIWECKCDCGKIKNIKRRDLTKKHKPTQSCGCLRVELIRNRMTGENHHSWKGTTSIDGKGYKQFRHGNLRNVKEHRHIYEQYYDIKLKPHQNIHHINGDRLDNRIENLELWNTSQPAGQRIEDKILYYHSLIQEYKDHPKYRELINNLNLV